MNFYHNADGQVAVLVSAGYGAGFSTWNDEALAYDARVVDLYLRNKMKFYTDEELAEQLAEMGYEDVYLGGWNDLELHWCRPGDRVRINEYDGSESLEIFDPDDEGWTVLE